MEGKVGSRHLAGVRETYRHYVEQQMRDEGYLPLLDLEPNWFVRYIVEEDAYFVRYSDQSAYYGKEDISCQAGWMFGEIMPMTKPQ